MIRGNGCVRENVDDIYDVPSHLLVPGHKYEVDIKLMSRDQSSEDDDDDESNRLMRVHRTETLSFRLCEYSMYEFVSYQPGLINAELMYKKRVFKIFHLFDGKLQYRKTFPLRYQSS